MCRFANCSETIRHFGHAVRKLSRPRFVLTGSRNVWELDERVRSSLIKPGVFEIPIDLSTPSYDTEVDIRFLFNGFEGGSISGFPMVFEDTI